MTKTKSITPVMHFGTWSAACDERVSANTEFVAEVTCSRCRRRILESARRHGVRVRGWANYLELMSGRT